MDTVKEEFKPIAPEFYFVELLKGQGVQVKASNVTVTPSGAAVFYEGDRAVVGYAPGRWVRFTWMKMNPPAQGTPAEGAE